MLEATVIIWIVVMAVIAELIDSSLGMMYGTLLSPILIVIGFDPFIVIPSILFSQAAGGFLAATKHHKHGNVNFHISSEDFKSFLMITGPGIVAVIIGSLVALSIPKAWLTIYISILVLVASVVILLKLRTRFSWKRMGFIGFISAFNKSLSGGGFGPFVTGGQVAIGQKSKNAIGVTTLSQVPICFSSFLAYFFLNGFSSWDFLGVLLIGTLIGAAAGPRITKKVNEEKLKIVVGVLALLSGLILISKSLNII